jgi:hypothetical protein
MYVTKSTIPREVKTRLDKDSLFYVRGEKLNPDIMGFYQPKPSGRKLALITPGLIIVEVKEGPQNQRHLSGKDVFRGFPWPQHLPDFG